MEPAVGAVVAGYEIVAPLGRGGQGQIFEAIDVALRRRVALKFLSADLLRDEQARKRFLLEARALSSLNHPGIATIYQIGEAEGRPFLAMEYVEGESLLDRLRRQPRTPDESLRLMVQIVEAVGYAHEAGILHRDLKPGNIMITKEGRAKLLDFGLAKLTSAALRERIQVDGALTSVGGMVGTIAYASPEQGIGDAIDERSDLFSLGIVFYELLAGKLPFSRETPVATFMAILHDPPPPLAPGSGLAAELAAVVTTLLEKEPARRYPSAAALLADLAAIAEAAPRPRSSIGPAPRHPRSSRRTLAVLAASVALVAAVAGAVWWIGVRPHGSPMRGGLLVLPLQASGEPDDRGLADLMTSQLIANLNRASGLRVLSLPERGAAGADLERLYDRLDVRYVIDGNLGISGEELAVSVKMVDRREASVLWSDTLRGPLDEVFTMTGRMATGAAYAAGVVVEAERLEFPGREAFDSFTRGSLAVLSYDPGQLARATDQLSRCIEIAPRFVPCYDRAIRAQLQYRNLGVDYDPAHLDRAHALIRRGLELDPSSPALGSALGWYRLYSYDYRGAWEALRTIPSPPGATLRDLKLQGWLLLFRGETTDALAAFDESRRTAPWETSVHLNLVVLNAMLGQREAAESAFQAAREAYASGLTRSIIAGWAQIARDDFAGAARTFRDAYTASRFPLISLAAAEAELAAGDPGAALADLEPWLQKNPYSLEGHWMAALAERQRGDATAARAAARRGARWAGELRARHPNPTVTLFELYFRSVAGERPPTVEEVRAVDIHDEARLTAYLQQVTLARLGDRAALDRPVTPYSPTFWLNRFAALELAELRAD